jgi:hypothetical protein
MFEGMEGMNFDSNVKGCKNLKEAMNLALILSDNEKVTRTHSSAVNLLKPMSGANKNMIRRISTNIMDTPNLEDIIILPKKDNKIEEENYLN